MGRLRFGTACRPAVTSGRGQRHSFTAHRYRQPGGPQGPPQPTSPAASTSSAVPASPPRTARGLPAPPGLAEEEAIGCQDGGGANGYPAPGCPAYVRPTRTHTRPPRQSPPLPSLGADVYTPSTCSRGACSVSCVRVPAVYCGDRRVFFRLLVLDSVLGSWWLRFR